MRFCADTWFLMKLFSKDFKAESVLRGCEEGKDWLLIPLVVFAEMSKKMLEKGIPQIRIDEFFNDLETVEKVRISFPSKEIASEAARVALSHSLSLLDAFVAATAKLSSCEVLLSKDSDYKFAIKQKYLKLQSW